MARFAEQPTVDRIRILADRERTVSALTDPDAKRVTPENTVAVRLLARTRRATQTWENSPTPFIDGEEKPVFAAFWVCSRWPESTA